MLTLNISFADIELLNYKRYSESSKLVQKRLHAIYLKAVTDLSHIQICQIVGIHRDTLTKYIGLYNESGIEGLLQVGYGTNCSELDQYKELLLSHFTDHPVHSIRAALQQIKQLTGLQRSPTQVRCWFHKHNFRPIKTGHVPAKANREKQEEFLQDTLEPLIQEAQQENIHLLFMDAAHFVMGVFQCILWCVERIFVKSSSGRKRYNVLGAVDAITKQIHILTNEEYINAVCIIDFLEQIRAYYKDDKPIYIVLDNARYQHCQLVKYMAWFLNIKLIFLPPYSPNLNIIERLWKWVKKRCLYATFYEDFNQFKEAIDLAIADANQKMKPEIESLLTLNFQRF